MQAIKELLNLSGKTAIVTGGAKGIGKAICYRLCEAGADVLVADVDLEEATKTAYELRGHNWSADSIAVDVSIQDDVIKMIDVLDSNNNSTYNSR